MPDSTTLHHFRSLLEEHKLGKRIFEDITNRLNKQGLIMHGGTIVDATILEAPSSTKNGKANAIRKCTRRRRAASGILA